MRRYQWSAWVGASVCAAFLSTGCAGLYLIFGPGGIWPPQQGSAVGGATTQPTVIASPLFLSDQADPLLEATAGAKVVVAAQLNDDNGDGVIDDNDEIDFVSGSDESQPIQIHLNQGGGASFGTISIAGGGPIARMIDLAVTDIDLDGRPDIAVLVNDTGFTPVEGAALRGAVVLLFAPPDPADALAWTQITVNATFLLASDEVGMTGFAVVDIDQAVEADGTTRRGPDIVLASNEVEDVNDYIRLYLNPGRGAGPAHLSRNGAAWGAGSVISVDALPFRAVKAADIDGDGDLDLVTASPTAKTKNVSWFVNPLIPAGPGAVIASWHRDFVGQQQDGADFVDVADIDGDGDLDVAAAKVSEGLVQWFENPDDPSAGRRIVAQQTFPWRVFNLGQIQGGYDIEQMRLVDLNRDGAVDCFVTANGSMAGMQRGLELYGLWLEFSMVVTNPVATIGRCAFADVNRDGLLDIIAPLDREGLTQDQILIYRRLTP